MVFDQDATKLRIPFDQLMAIRQIVQELYMENIEIPQQKIYTEKSISIATFSET